MRLENFLDLVFPCRDFSSMVAIVVWFVGCLTASLEQLFHLTTS